MKRYWQIGYFLAISVVLNACAQMGEPNGGPKDATAPELLPDKSHPQNRSVNFKEHEIELVFNEYINLNAQLVTCTPAIQPKPVFKANGKKVNISFSNSLQENTTYTFNFSGAINDITENNSVENLSYVISTGSFIDSMSISGYVKDAFAKNNVGACTVILHEAENDSAIYNAVPMYYLKTDKNGFFKFSNIKKGKYRLYALNDKNTDLKFNGYPEEIAFNNLIYELDSAIQNIELFRSPQKRKAIVLRKTQFISKNTQVYYFTSALSDIHCTSLNYPEKLNYTYSPTDSIIYISLNDSLINDTIKVSVSANSNKFTDTIVFTAHLSKKMKNSITLQCLVLPELFAYDSLIIKTNSLFTIDQSKINFTDTLHKKSVNFKIHQRDFEFSLLPDVSNEKIPLQVSLLPGAVKSKNHNSQNNDTLHYFTLSLPEEKCGSIELKVTNSELTSFKNPVCVILLENKKIFSKKLEPLMNFNFLKPGMYRIYVFEDIDNNGQWSPSDFDQKINAENIIWFNQTIKVKANWQQNITWI